MTRDQSRNICQLFVERNGRAATIVTSNRDTVKRITAFDDVLFAPSAVNRFANNAFDLVVEGESYRTGLLPPVTGDDPSRLCRSPSLTTPCAGESAEQGASAPAAPAGVTTTAATGVLTTTVVGPTPGPMTLEIDWSHQRANRQCPLARPRFGQVTKAQQVLGSERSALRTLEQNSGGGD